MRGEWAPRREPHLRWQNLAALSALDETHFYHRLVELQPRGRAVEIPNLSQAECRRYSGIWYTRWNGVRKPALMRDDSVDYLL